MLIHINLHKYLINYIQFKYCRSQFGKIRNRRHHCRLCGKLICNNCIEDIPLYLDINNGNESYINIYILSIIFIIFSNT